MQQLLEPLRRRLGEFGLSVSLWTPTGAPISDPQPAAEFCEQLCGQHKSSREAMGQLAQRACLEGGAVTSTGPAGCVLLAAPVHRRRRLVGAALACFPAADTSQTEAFARACSQLRLDAAVMADLCRQAARHQAAQAKQLCQMLQWLIEDEQAKQTAGGELVTLSANLASSYEELSLLYRISGSMRVTQSPEEFFGNVCEELLDVMRIEAAAAVLSPREHGGQAEQIVVAGQAAPTKAQLSRIVRECVLGQLSEDMHPNINNQFGEHARQLGVPAAGIDTLIAVPLTSAGRYKGVLLGINKIDAEFDSIDLKLVSSISSQAAVFLENQHLYQDLQDLLMGMLHALTASIDAKDPYTCGHSQRVAMISRKLAELSGFDGRRAGRIYLAGLLHDIGKIGMPESVLLKKGKLTDAEYEKVKEHPAVGANILGGIPQMEDILPAVLHHHERLDGRGYPDALVGGKIPAEALIVGLADSFDAMTSHRTYRAAMPLEAVVDEIRRCAGRQFDSELVERLLSLDLAAFLNQLREVSDVAAPTGGGR